MNIDEINNKINVINHYINFRTKDLRKELDALYIERTKICPHNNTEYNKAWIDVGWDYRDKSNAWIKCKDCGLVLTDGECTMEEQKVFNQIEQKHLMKGL